MPASPPRPASQRPPFFTRVIAFAAMLALGWALVLIVRPFFSPLVWACFLALLFHPLHRALTRRLGGHAGISAMLLTVATLVLILGPLTALSGSMASEAGNLLQRVQDGVSVSSDGARLSRPGLHALEPLVAWTHRVTGMSTSQVRTIATQAAHSVLQYLAVAGGSFVLGAFSTLMNAGITVFLEFFFIRDGEHIMRTVRQITPLPPQLRDRLMTRLATVVRAVIFGTGLGALIHGILIGVSFMIVGLPSPLVFGALAAVLALLPIGGTAFVWVPAVIVLAARAHWGAAIFMLAWGLVTVLVLDNVVKPMLVSRHAPIATVTMFLGVLGGISAFGAVGMFLGPILLALMITLIEFSVELRSDRESGLDPASTAGATAGAAADDAAATPHSTGTAPPP